jgi:hypothetical protein
VIRGTSSTRSISGFAENAVGEKTKNSNEKRASRHLSGSPAIRLLSTDLAEHSDKELPYYSRQIAA